MKKNKKALLLLFLHIFSLMLFEVFFDAIRNNDLIAFLDENGKNGMFAIFAPYVEAGFYHFICSSILAIYMLFNKKISEITKNIIYLYPFLSIMATLPTAMIIAVGGITIKGAW